jgi:dihydroorotase
MYSGEPSPMERSIASRLTTRRTGMIGLELCLPLLLGLVRDGVLPLARLVEALTVAPARVVGIDPPAIREGARADLVLVDPRARWTVDRAHLETKSFNTPFAGRTVDGKVAITMCEGRIVHEDPEGTW